MTKTIKTKPLFLAIIVTLVCVCFSFAIAFPTSANSESDGNIILSECTAKLGTTASVTVSIENNPGIAVASITLDYDRNALVLKEVKNGEIFSSVDSGVNILWSADETCNGDGLLATLIFEIKEDAETKDYVISAVVNEVLNEDGEELALAVSDGKITAVDFLYGDANGDSKIGAIDVLVLRKYMANYNYIAGTSTVTVGYGADANGDGTVGIADVLLMRKYMANYDYSGGTCTIVLGPPVTTEPPVTQEPTIEEKDIVTEYIYHVLSDKSLDFLNAYLTYAYGKSEEKIADIGNVKAVLAETPNNDRYTISDIAAMVELYDKAVIAILRADTIDEVNSIVARFVASLAETATYAERVVAAYEAIDFDSNYDVLDVVYANALLDRALLEMKASDIEAIKRYGEDEINIVERIYTEYYRYTGVKNSGMSDAAIGEDDILYSDMYAAAGEVASAVYGLFAAGQGEELDAYALVYFADITEPLEAAEAAYETWYRRYFADALDTELFSAYEAFRQAFISEDYILEYSNDYVWEALAAAALRVEHFLDAVEDAKAFAENIKSIAILEMDAADYNYFKYYRQIDKVASIKTALAAWKEKYDFKDNLDGTENPNVAAIINTEETTDVYSAYKANALVVEYFAYLENTANEIDVNTFIDASEEDLNDIRYNFDFVKRGNAVGDVLDWYFGSENTASDIREGGFISIVASQQEGFEALSSDYDVANLLASGNPNIIHIFEWLFDVDITVDIDPATEGTQTVFDFMLQSYSALAAKKKAADAINGDIAKALERGIMFAVVADFVELFDGDYEKFAEASDSEKINYMTVGSSADINVWAEGIITVGDNNFEGMIDWASLDTLYNNYKESLKAVIADSAEAALEYIAWQAAINGNASYDAEEEQIKFTYSGNDYYFSDLKPAQIDIYSYSRIKNVIALEKTLEDLFDVENNKVVEALKKLTADVPDDDNALSISLAAIVDYCADMVYDFYSKIQSGVHVAVENMKAAHPLINAFYQNAANKWKSAGANLIDVAMLNRITGTNAAEYEVIKGAVQHVLESYKYKSTVGYGTNYGIAASLTVWANSYQGAIYSVDPIDYAKRNADADDKIIGFDDAGYKAALNTAITKAYNAFLPAYVKDPANASDFTALINKFTTTVLNYGLWTIEGETVIGGETYTYLVNSTGDTVSFNVYDPADKRVASDIAVEIGSVEYKVALTPLYDYDNGKVIITPVLTSGTLPESEKDVYGLLGLNDADLTYDIRDYAVEIGANFDKISTTLLVDGTACQTLSVDELQKFFEYETKNDFYVTFELLCARMYQKNVSGTWRAFGDYIDFATYNALDASVRQSLGTLSMLARDTVMDMTVENNTVADIELEFNKFTARVKEILTEAGYGFTTDIVNGYEKITAINQ